jgi:hypothetical protein
MWSKVEQSLGPVIRTLQPLRPCLVGLCLPARSAYLFRKHTRTDLETHVLETPSVIVITATEYYLRYVVPEGYGMLWVGDAPPDRRLVQYDIAASISGSGTFAARKCAGGSSSEVQGEEVRSSHRRWR